MLLFVTNNVSRTFSMSPSFFFNDTATPGIYTYCHTLSLHDALPIFFGDVWRMEKAYCYAENMHGLDWDAVRARYEPLLEHVGRREDLNELLVEMIAEMQVGHNRVGGGEVYDNKVAAPGLLGADFRIEGGHYGIARLFDGEQGNPFISAPLAAPGVDVKEGDYILAIHGRDRKSTRLNSSH